MEAEAVVDFQVPLRRRRNITRRVLYLVALAGLFTGYGIIKEKQLNGQFLQTNVYVQFGDEYRPNLSYYSGVFQSTLERTSSRRKYRDTATGTILLGYCSVEGVWTFSWEEDDDSCNYFAASAKTRSFVMP